MTGTAAGMVIVGPARATHGRLLRCANRVYQGSVVLIGAERHAPYERQHERQPLSKSALADPDARLKAIVDPAGLGKIEIKWMSAAPAVAIDRIARSVRLADGREIACDKLLLATGTLPCRLPLATNNPNAVYLRTFDEAIALGARLRQGARVAVIGGGFIGLELAAAAHQQGCPVGAHSPDRTRNRAWLGDSIALRPRTGDSGFPMGVTANHERLHAGLNHARGFQQQHSGRGYLAFLRSGRQRRGQTRNARCAFIDWA
jgi:hypothetical protein